MILDIPLLLLLIIIVALFFDYSNGTLDSSKIISGVVSTRVLTPKSALILSCVFTFLGAMLGTEVAITIGKGLINTELIINCKSLILATLLSALFWNYLMWYVKLPSSAAHTIIGGLIGASIVYAGFGCVNYYNLMFKVVIPLFLSSIAGFIAGYILITFLAWLTFKMKYRTANNTFKYLQILSTGFMALSHGSNSAQKTMGIITLSLLIFGQIDTLDIPLWVRLSCISAITIGQLSGGIRIIKTIGFKMFNMTPLHNFASQMSTSIIIVTCSFFGIPLSTANVISSSLLGTGAAAKLSNVKWNTAKQIVISWILTLPATIIFGGLIMYLFLIIGL